MKSTMQLVEIIGCCGTSFSAVLLALLLFAPATLRAETPAEVLQAAIEKSAPKVFTSAEIQFRAELQLPLPDLAVIEEAVARQAEAIQMQIDRFRDQPKVREMFEKALAENERNVSAQLLLNARQDLSVKFRMSGPDIGGVRWYDYQTKRPGSKAPVRLLLLQSRLDEESGRSAFVDVSARHALVENRLSTIGIPDPQLAGRLPEPLLALLEMHLANDLDCKLDESYVKQQPGEVCVTFSSKRTDLILSGKVVVDTKRGYICPRIEFATEHGKFRAESDDFFVVESAELWFPKEYKLDSKTLQGERTTTYYFAEADVSLNKPVSRESLSLVIPAGTSISYELDPPKQYQARCDVRVEIDRLDQLPKDACVE